MLLKKKNKTKTVPPDDCPFYLLLALNYKSKWQEQL